MEDKVAEKLTNTNVGNGLERNVRIANHEVDFIIKRNFFTKDCLVEVKYIRKGFNFGWLKEVFLRHLYKKSLYEQFRGKKASTLLLILIEDAIFKVRRESCPHDCLTQVRAERPAVSSAVAYRSIRCR
ncbi:hypothetical protein C6H65_17580 [Photorhabdus luminescens]|nr:hypothetical protein C6H65_17580 [Photorhabdus luminescens]